MYDQVNKELEKYFGEDGVKLVPSDLYGYSLLFNDHIKMTPASIAFAKAVVAKYDKTKQFGDELYESGW